MLSSKACPDNSGKSCQAGKFFLHTLLFFLMVTQICFAQWDVLHESLVGPLNAIDFVDENVGWLAGDKGTLLKTTDGGENWNPFSIGESWHIYEIDFVNESVGWVIGHNWDTDEASIIAITFAGGGFTWSIQKQIMDPSGILGLNLHVVDGSTVFVLIYDKIFKTTNAGTDWIDVSPNLPNRNYNSLWFQDAYAGIVVGNYNDGTAERGIILKTSNGGSNWNETIVNDFNSIYDIQFLDNSNGYFRAHMDTAYYLCKTKDMFSSWSIILQVPQYWSFATPLKSYQFIDTTTAYTIIEDGNELDHVLKSIDGGQTWEEISRPTEGISLGGIYFSQLSTGFILGFQGRIFELFRSNDYGLNWKLEDFSIPIIDISFIDENKAFMFGGYSWGHGASVGGEYTILATSDGGSEWNTKLAIHCLKASYYLMNNSVGFIIHDRPWWSGNWLLKTTDFGDSWIDVTPDSGFSGSDIIFQNDLTGWMVGDKIYKTTDCGASWYVDFSDSLEGFYLRSISLAPTTIWAVGNIGFNEEGVMIKYTPQTGWVRQTSVTNLLLSKVVFLDDNNGWIAGGSEWVNGFTKIFLKTTDGGLNWNAINNIPYLMRDLQYIDSNIGWAIGYTYDYFHQGEGGILKTTDGGVTWSLHLSMTDSRLRGIHFLDASNGWAVGENGTILHTTNGGVSFIEEEVIDEMPTEFLLSQNYPNPFNPSTKIKYSIPQSSNVVIKVFDVLGNEIETLVNEEKPIGTYEITWNAVNLPSGVYFYQLLVSALQSKDGKAGDFIQTKKMVLMK